MSNPLEEAVADAIKFLAMYEPPGWTQKGLTETKWPKDFSKTEQARIRAIAKTAIATIENELTKTLLLGLGIEPSNENAAARGSRRKSAIRSTGKRRHDDRNR